MVFGKKKATKAKPKAKPKKAFKKVDFVKHTCFPRSDKTLCEACVAAAEK
jgi:hypothetical protein